MSNLKSVEDEDDPSGVTVYWFRNALRLHDNPSLYEACAQEKTSFLLPIYIIDPDSPFAQTDGRRAGAIRANFCLQSITNLQEKMLTLNSRIIILQGKPETILPRICSEFGVTKLIFETETASPVRNRDMIIIDAIKTSCNNKVEVIIHDTHSLFEMEQYLSKCPSKVVPLTFLSFKKLFNKLLPVPAEVPQVLHIPPLPSHYHNKLNSIMGLEDPDQSSSASVAISNKSSFDVPTLSELGYEYEPDYVRNYIFIGGEDVALGKLDTMILHRKNWVIDFGNVKSLITLNANTGLSPYVKHGCISIRRIYHSISGIYSTIPNFVEPSESLRNQLLWREYSYISGYATPNFDKMLGNPRARQIPWKSPHNVDPTSLFYRWKNAQTGYPIIDAIITELNTTGWIHYLARDTVARFLTRGALWQHWEAGAAYFEERLIDADWSINNFNWQKSSCTSQDFRYTKCPSPISFGKKLENNVEYIRKWIPLFKTFPEKFINEPWTAPRAIQEGCGIVIGIEYPYPIVDFSMVKQENLDRMKKAFDEHKKKSQRKK